MNTISRYVCFKTQLFTFFLPINILLICFQHFALFILSKFPIFLQKNTILISYQIKQINSFNNNDRNNLYGDPTKRALRPAQQQPKAYRNRSYLRRRSTSYVYSKPADNTEDFFENYRLHQNFFTKDDLKNQPNFTMVKGKNYMYFGGFVDHMKHGYGILVAGDTAYEGSFKLNLKMGKGYLKFSSGATYLGDFVNSKPHGNGTFTYPSL